MACTRLEREGKNIALLVFGSQLETALKVADKLDASVIDMRFVKPLDSDMIDQVVASHQVLFTLEDNAIAGGAGSAVSEYLAGLDNAPPCHPLGYPDEYVKHGQPDEVRALWELDEAGLSQRITALTPDKLLI